MGTFGFSSLEEGLYFSILKKNLHIEPFSLVVGVSLFKTIKTLYGIRAFIKWPKRYIRFIGKGQKVAGIW
jgi:hypothetical protein